MKELSIEQKAKRYNEALVRAKKLQKTCDSQAVIGWCEYIFPELKESDERIRKAIIEHFAGSHPCMFPYKGFTKEQILAWLEKQVSPEDKGEISDGYHTFNELYYYRMLYNAAFFNSLPKVWVHKSKKHHDGEECFGGGWFIVMANLPTGQISNHYELKDWELFQIPEKEVADEWDGHTPKEAAERLHKYLLMQKEQELLCAKCRKDNPYSSCQEVTAFGNCTVEDEPTQANKVEPKSDERKDFISIPFGAFDSELIEETITIPDGCVATIEGNRIHIKKEGKTALEAIKEEKVDNANKVEPKFKVGDWLQYRNAKPFYVEGITSQGYVNGISCLPFSWEDEIHLWSIADAQAGDVLVASDGSIFLFAGVVDCACKYYVSLTTGNYVKINKNKEVKGGYWETSRAVHPATKEQCALLFQKMREEGYEWDSEKKKIKKDNGEQ